MHIIIVLAAAVALLYFWLLGHWFARIVAFLLFAVITGLGGGAMFAAIAAVPNAQGPFIVGAILGLPLAWPLASLPIYYYRRQARKLDEAIQRSFEPPPGGFNYSQLTRL